MTIKTGQLIYRVRGPDGLWLQKTGGVVPAKWVQDEHSGTYWRKLHHLKAALSEGVLTREDVTEGVPHAAFKVYEYEVTIERTGRKNRLTELVRFHEPIVPPPCMHENTRASYDPSKPGLCTDCGEEV